MDGIDLPSHARRHAMTSRRHGVAAYRRQRATCPTCGQDVVTGQPEGAYTVRVEPELPAPVMTGVGGNYLQEWTPGLPASASEAPPVASPPAEAAALPMGFVECVVVGLSAAAVVGLLLLISTQAGGH